MLEISWNCGADLSGNLLSMWWQFVSNLVGLYWISGSNGVVITDQVTVL